MRELFRSQQWADVKRIEKQTEFSRRRSAQNRLSWELVQRLAVHS
jgi:hypothetical protein